MKSTSIIFAVVFAFQLFSTEPALAATGSPELERHALAAPAVAESSVPALAAYLVSNAKTEVDKAWVIFRWVADRVSYDIDAYLAGHVRDPEVTAEQVLAKRSSVCDGYALLFRELARHAGLEVVKLSGYAKAYGVPPNSVFDSENHAWNLVKINGVWRIVDPTWGAGYVNDDKYKKKLDPLYFFAEPQQIKFTHWSQDASWHGVAVPGISKAEFETMPQVDPGLFHAGVSGEALSQAARTPGFREFVHVFEQNHQDLMVLDAPLVGHLQAGKAYRFRYRAEAFEEIVAIHDGKWERLTRTGNVFEANLQPGPGNVMVVGRTKATGRPTSLFEYTVE
ncbi:MAG: transglutaminase domain-containing protein [Sterolibacterium sp.]